MDYNGWTMRVRHAVGEPARLILLLHGWTGDENSMWVFAHKFPENLWIAAPRAPHSAEGGWYSWRALPPGAWGLPTLSDLKPAADSLIRLVDDISVLVGLDATQFDVAGCGANQDESILPDSGPLCYCPLEQVVVDRLGDLAV